jgi:hypothetical protein
MNNRMNRRHLVDKPLNQKSASLARMQYGAQRYCFGDFERHYIAVVLMMK